MRFDAYTAEAFIDTYVGNYVALGECDIAITTSFQLLSLALE